MAVFSNCSGILDHRSCFHSWGQFSKACRIYLLLLASHCDHLSTAVVFAIVVAGALVMNYTITLGEKRVLLMQIIIMSLHSFYIYFVEKRHFHDLSNKVVINLAVFRMTLMAKLSGKMCSCL